MHKILRFGAIGLFLLFLAGLCGCDKMTSPSPLDGIWLVESVDNESGLSMPARYETAEAVWWEFQNVLFRITYRPAGTEGNGQAQVMWGYPVFDRDYVTFTPTEGLVGKVPFPVPGGEGLGELRLRYETAHNRITLYGEGYTIHLVRR